MDWSSTPLNELLVKVKEFQAQGLMLKEVAEFFGVSNSTITKFSRHYEIEWRRGARKGNKNAEVHGQGHNTIKRLTLRIMLEAGKDIATCERCGFHHPLNESLARHHKDRNRTNNDISNLEVLCHSCHSLEHKDDRPRNKAGQFKTIDDCGGGLGGV